MVLTKFYTKDIASEEDAAKNLDVESKPINYGKCDLCDMPIIEKDFGPAVLKAYDMKLKAHPECIIAGQIKYLKDNTAWFMFNLKK